MSGLWKFVRQIRKESIHISYIHIYIYTQMCIQIHVYVCMKKYNYKCNTHKYLSKHKYRYGHETHTPHTYTLYCNTTCTSSVLPQANPASSGLERCSLWARCQLSLGSSALLVSKGLKPAPKHMSWVPQLPPPSTTAQGSPSLKRI